MHGYVIKAPLKRCLLMVVLYTSTRATYCAFFYAQEHTLMKTRPAEISCPTCNQNTLLATEPEFRGENGLTTEYECLYPACRKVSLSRRIFVYGTGIGIRLLLGCRLLIP